jgi:hypothetical protein
MRTTATVFAALSLLAPLVVPVWASGPQNDTDQAVEQREQLAAKTPNDPEAWQTPAAYYSEKAKDASQRRR